MQVVAVQLDMVWEQKQANHQKILQLLKDVEIRTGALIVLPEMFDTGFSMNVDAVAQSEARESETFLQELARQYDSAVMGGIVTRDAISGLGANEAVVFDPSGSELARYRKMQPFSLSGENLRYTPGDHHVIFQWQGVRISPLICYDVRFPERCRFAVQDGAEMFVAIACWPAVRSEHWVRLLQARAIENLSLVVGVNRCGQEPKLTFDGRTCAFDHMGKCLLEADAREQVACIDLDVASMRRWRDKFPALRDIRPFGPVVVAEESA